MKSSLYFYISLGILGFLAGTPIHAQAQQPETSVSCDEGVIAEPIALDYGDSTTDCVIDSPPDLDRFTFHGEAGTDIRISVWSPDGLDARLEVRDPNGEVIYDNWCVNSCSFSADLALTETGIYQAALSDMQTNEGGSYQLGLQCMFGACDSDGVPPADSDPPAIFYDAPVDDVISPETDLHRFTFQGEAGTDIRISVFSPDGLDARLEVRDPTGAVIYDNWCVNSCSFSADLFLTETGNYQAALSDKQTNEGGSYQLGLQCMFGICVTDSDEDGIPDREPPQLMYDVPLSGEVSFATDLDRITFHGEAGTDIRISVLSPDGLDARLEVRDPTGAVIYDNWCVNSCSFSADLSLTETGTYQLAISDKQTNEGGGYEIGLQCLFGACTDGNPPPDGGDNCRLVPNGPLLPDPGGLLQLDTDGDGIGNLCDCDFNNDNFCGGPDFTDFIVCFNALTGGDPLCEAADMNGDGFVGGPDFTLFIGGFNAPPGPPSLNLLIE